MRGNANSRRELERRLEGLDDAEADAPPLAVWLSAGPETCVDDAACLHEVGSKRWRFPRELHEAVMGRGDATVGDYFGGDGSA